jgi:hypothetical protein
MLKSVNTSGKSIIFISSYLFGGCCHRSFIRKNLSQNRYVDLIFQMN